MDKPQPKVSQKVLKTTNSVHSSGSWSSAGSMIKGEQKERLADKEKASSGSPSSKENTKPQDFMLHTQQRAVRRAMFNHFVATKLYLNERQKRTEKKILKMIEDEEVRLLRKEMVPKAQLMPFFDRPFFPQRSNRPLTIPREPTKNLLGGRSNSYGLQSFQTVKSIK